MNAPNFVRISPTLLRPRLPELGKIKIGGKGETRRGKGGREWQLPVKYTHFVVTTRQRGQDGNFVRDEAIHRVIGPKPTELDIRLMWDLPEQNFRASLTAYDGKKRVCEGDGTRAYDRALGREIPCTCPLLKQHEGGYDGPSRPVGKVVCKPYGVLSVILEAAEVYGGYYVFRTTSWETISAITAALHTFREQFGFLAGLPLRMVMYPTTDTYEEGGQTKTSQSYKVGLVVRGSFEAARQVAAAAHERLHQLRLPSPEAAEMHAQDLAAAEEREAEDIAREFYPETQTGVLLEAEIVDEGDDADDGTEDLIRLALEYADWDPVKINAQVARYAGRLDELLAKMREQMPRAVEKAELDIAEREAREAAEASGRGETGEPTATASGGNNLELL